MLDRRQFLTGVASGLVGLALPRHGWSQQAGITRLTERLSLITAGGSNVLACVGAEGQVLCERTLSFLEDVGTPEAYLAPRREAPERWWEAFRKKRA